MPPRPHLDEAEPKGTAGGAWTERWDGESAGQAGAPGVFLEGKETREKCEGGEEEGGKEREVRFGTVGGTGMHAMYSVHGWGGVGWGLCLEHPRDLGFFGEPGGGRIVVTGRDS